MTKLLSLLLLPFTIVLVQAVFENAGENCGVKIWRVIVAREIRRHYEEIMPHHTYIILKTEAHNTQKKKKIHHIYYVNNSWTQDDRLGLVFNIVELWRELQSKYVTLIRKQFVSENYTLADIIGESTLPEKLLLFLPWGQQSNPLKIFQNCNQVPHLYASSRENNEVLEILIADGLTSTQDFILQCGSKALVFNVAGNVPVDQSKKLAAFITGDESKIYTGIWSYELPESLLNVFPRMLTPQTFIEYFGRTSSSFMSVAIWEYYSVLTTDEPNYYTGVAMGSGPLSIKLESTKCYVLINNKTKEATVFIGEHADYRIRVRCLVRGEDIASTDHIKSLSVVQKHTLTASFILVFKDVLENFPDSLANPISYIMVPENSQ